jgi:hypothetical protein
MTSNSESVKKIPRPMTSEIATGGGPPLSILGELRDFPFVEVRDARWLQEGIVEISHLSIRVRRDNKSIEHEHPTSE